MIAAAVKSGMGLERRWVGTEELSRVAETRMLCYAGGRSELPAVIERAQNDYRAKGGEFLLIERDGRPVGTSTSYSFTMFARGAAIPAQGVGWVGTVRTERRKSGTGEPGIATIVMQETLRRARERGDLVSALMPFRASYYEHFGYGLVERRCDWTIPLNLLPSGSTDGLRFYEPGDFDELLACRNRIAANGQCDFVRSAALMEQLLQKGDEGFVIVDRPENQGPVRGWMTLFTVPKDGHKYVKIGDRGSDDSAGLVRQLRMLGTLKDQYFGAMLTMPADFQLNRLLKESQLPHRPVEHSIPQVSYYTRMQIRILDHRKFLEALHLPLTIRGALTVEVQECEGSLSRFRMEIDSGQVTVKPATDDPTFRCADTTWASIVCGDLTGSAAVRTGIAEGDGALLDVFSAGAAPFTSEHF